MIDLYRILILNIFIILLSSIYECKLVWKVKPQPYQIAREYENVRLNCEFEEKDNVNTNTANNQYFVIWYRDGMSQNVLALNDKLANLNSTNYEIIGKYNLLIKNVTKNHSGLYTCQLFQSNDLISSVNLTVLVPPKYAKINLKQQLNNASPYQLTNKGYLVENDRINLECCTNSDSNPEPIFEWHKIDRQQPGQKITLVNSNQYSNSSYVTSDSKLCNVLQLNLTKSDNNYVYKCLISNEALKNQKSVEDSVSLTIEYKPDVKVHLLNNSQINNSVRLIENSSISLYCNSTALPNIQTYQWYFDDLPIRDQQSNVLNLKYLNKFQSGFYSCKATNKHGSTRSHIRVDVLYIKISAFNNRTLAYLESSNLRQPDSIYINTYENSSLALTCQIESNPVYEKVVWFYYQINKENKIINKVMLSNWISGTNRILNDTHKLYFSQLNLINVTSNHSGYYSCSIQTKLTDDLNQSLLINSNTSYYLQVQYSPTVRAVKKSVYANNYDQIELSCEVKSNPQSIISWFFGTKELFSNYKYNLTNTVYKQIHRAYLDDMDNIHYYRSTLTVNSLTQFDYGDYYCRANNIIGENGQIVKLKRKEKPETPIDFRLVSTSSNSVKLSWLSASNGGENSTYLITINNVYNLSTIMEDENLNDGVENRYNSIEIKGLQSLQTYYFKILAFNSMGSSEFSDTIKATTLHTSLKSDHLPDILNAQYNELREAICFEIDQLVDSQLKREQKYKDLVVKIDVNLNLNEFENLTLINEFQIENLKFNLTKTKTFLITLSKLNKYGQNCIPFSQLIELDWELRNNSIYTKHYQLNKKQDYSYTVNSALFNLNEHTETKSELLARNFYEFKKIHLVNLSICYLNDSSICSNQIKVKDYSPDISTYITLIAIGCSAILIFIVLLIASLCCCCCRRSKANKKAEKQMRKNDLNSKLVIKSFPIVTNHQGNYDYSDSSCKSSQQHILNGSGSTHSGSSTYSRANEKLFYHNAQNIFDPNLPTKFNANSYKIDFSQNMSSIATVESDTSSSTSIENKTLSTSNGKSSSTHSPFTLPNDNQINSCFSSYTQKVSKPQTILYNGSNNMFIKSYQQQQQQQQQSRIIGSESNESAYSTPINMANSTNMGKKLVYEVIV